VIKCTRKRIRKRNQRSLKKIEEIMNVSMEKNKELLKKLAEM
jgi:hypothetical protein